MEIHDIMEKLLDDLKDVNANITSDMIKNASKEQLEEYLKLSEEIEAKIEGILEN